MSGLSDILGSLIQAGISPSGNQRMRNTIGAGGPSTDSGLNDILGSIGGALSGMSSNAPGSSGSNTQFPDSNSQSGGILGGLSDLLGGAASKTSDQQTGSGGFGGLGDLLGGALGDAGRSLGSNNNVAVGGLGALIGSLFGGGGSSVKGAMGGGAMALLAALAYSALKNAGSAPTQTPAGLIENHTDAQKAEIEQEADLALRAMINAAKADGQIDKEEMQRIIGHLEKDGIDENQRQQLIAEMQKPYDLDGLIKAVNGDQQIAAQVYIASLLAIEVDTKAEQAYMQQLANGLGLPQRAVSNIEMAMGMR